MDKFLFIWCLSHLLYFEAYAEQSSQHSRKLPDDSRCIFDLSRNTYNVTDLLGCMNELAKNPFAQSNDRSLMMRQAGQSPDPLTREKDSYRFPYVDVLANLFNTGASPVHQTPLSDFIASNYHQLGHPDAPDESFGQFDGLNLLGALSSITRHDDLRCVSRILCEVASGNTPRQYKQASTGDDKRLGGLEDLGRNALIQWLAGFDVGGTSPVLSFARAAALGYTGRGNPATCYRAFPRCPRNPDKLVHYLNNHNGGFFRFFSEGYGGGGYGGGYSQPPHVLQGNAGFVRGRRRKAPPPGTAGAEADRTGTGKLKFDVPVLIMRQDYGRSFFPTENILESSGRVVFPDREEANDHPSENRIPKSLSDLPNSDVNTLARDPPPFFPRESENQGVRALRFTSELSDAAVNNGFRFPYE